MSFRIGESYFTTSQSLDGRSIRDWVAEVMARELRDLPCKY